MKTLPEIQALLSDLDLAHSYKSNKIAVKFCANIENAITGRYSVMLLLNPHNMTINFFDAGSVITSCQTPLEGCDMYTRVAKFIRDVGYEVSY